MPRRWLRAAWAPGAPRIAVLVAAAILALAAAVIYQMPPGPQVLRPADAEVLSAGRKVYQQHCASCHGERLEGQPNWRRRDARGRLPAPPHDASGHTWHHPDRLLFAITKYGVAKAAKLEHYESAMPAFGGVLSDEEIRAVLSWIKAQWPAGIRARHDEMNASSKGKP